MKKLQLGVVLFSLVFVLGGCETLEKKDAETEGSAKVEDRTASDDRASAYPVDDESYETATPLEDPDNSAALSQRIIYFDYDSSEVETKYREVVQAHARRLANNPTFAVTLEGHADERGSREYNLALGERRANTIRQQMVLLGAAAEQLRSVSYGEERPRVEGHDETSWAQNRRVEILY